MCLRLRAHLHVVAQVVEAELVVGAVGDVAAVGVLALDVLDLVAHAAHGEPEEGVDLSHPLGIAAGQVVVDRDHLHSAPGQRVEHHCEGCHQGLALTGLHLGDATLVEHDATHELDVEVTHGHGPARGLTHQGEDLDELLVEDPLHGVAALLEVLRQVLGGRAHAVADGGKADAELVVGETLHLRLQGVDGGHHRPHPLDVLPVFGAEDGADGLFDQIHRVTPIAGTSPGPMLAHDDIRTRVRLVCFVPTSTSTSTRTRKPLPRSSKSIRSGGFSSAFRPRFADGPWPSGHGLQGLERGPDRCGAPILAAIRVARRAEHSRVQAGSPHHNRQRIDPLLGSDEDSRGAAQ